MNRLTDYQRKLMDEGHALVVHCNGCNSEYFLGTLPMEMGDLVKVTRRFKCPSDKSHKLLMGALAVTSHNSQEGS
jgi:hypothetical protein